MSETQARVKKVKAFPFAATLSAGGQPVPCHVLKMNLQGLMIEVAGYLKVGQKYELQFQLPVLKAGVTSRVVAIRTMDQYAASVAAGGSSLRIAELHFIELSGASRESVVEFLKRIGVAR